MPSHAQQQFRDSKEFPRLSECTLEINDDPINDGPWMCVGKKSQTQQPSTICDFDPLTLIERRFLDAINTRNLQMIIQLALFISGGRDIYTEHRTIIEKDECKRRWHILIRSPKLVKAICKTENSTSYEYLLDVSYRGRSICYE